MDEMQYAIEMINITKEFPGIKANDDITLRIKKGEIHALIGENGAGKSTLMSILFGLYQPTSGYIKINNKKKIINGPNDATDLGIGMVHQHFKLVDIYSALENIILGSETTKWGQILKTKEAKIKIKGISEKYNLPIKLKNKIENCTVGEQQRIEIIKMLYRDAEILIFDEPTAVLSPQEINGLLKTMNDFRDAGKTIIFITHKLNEIKKVADRATIIRHGKLIDTVNVSKTTIKEMASMMVGRKIVEVKNNQEPILGETVLRVESLFVPHRSQKRTNGLIDASFEVKRGEIVAIAGVEGNGQTELINAISGLSKPSSGKIFLKEIDITSSNIRNRYTSGISHIPEDRHKHAMILDFNIRKNMVLQNIFDAPFSKRGIINNSEIQRWTNNIIQDFDVRGARNGKSIARQLSGGNQQKAVVGREMSRKHDLLITAQPTRGLDLGAIENIHKLLIEEKTIHNNAVLLISYELDEVIALADRIVVLNSGKISGIVDAKKVTREDIGLLMAGESGGTKNE